MNSKVLEAIVAELSAFIEANGFTANEAGDTYKNEKIAFKISNDEEKKLLILEVAAVSEDETVGEYTVASSWLFEDTENLRDAASAGMDFLDTLKGKLGIKGVRTNRNGEIALPKKEAGSKVDLESLSGKCLAIYPELKEAYKQHVAEYGSLLYVDFYSKQVAPLVAASLDANNKKSLKKLFAMLNEMYSKGDRTVQNIVVGLILGGACKGNTQRYETALTNLEETPHLKKAFQSIMPLVNKDKRFKAMLG